MSQPPLTPQQEALPQDLADAIRHGTDDPITQITRTLAATSQLFRRPGTGGVPDGRGGRPRSWRGSGVGC
jgi:hypothetical protein